MANVSGKIGTRMTYSGIAGEIIRLSTKDVLPATQVMSFNYFSTPKIDVSVFANNMLLFHTLRLTGGKVGSIGETPVASMIIYVPLNTIPQPITDLSVYIKFISAARVTASISLLDVNPYAEEPIIIDPIQELNFTTTQTDGVVSWDGD
jgi:hypothetical protein